MHYEIAPRDRSRRVKSEVIGSGNLNQNRIQTGACPAAVRCTHHEHVTRLSVQGAFAGKRREAAAGYGNLRNACARKLHRVRRIPIVEGERAAAPRSTHVERERRP